MGSRTNGLQDQERVSDEAFAQRKPGEVGASAASGFIPDPVQVRTHGVDANVQPIGDLRVGTALGDQGDQFPLAGAQLPAAGLVPGRPASALAGDANVFCARGPGQARLVCIHSSSFSPVILGEQCEKNEFERPSIMEITIESRCGGSTYCRARRRRRPRPLVLPATTSGAAYCGSACRPGLTTPACGGTLALSSSGMAASCVCCVRSNRSSSRVTTRSPERTRFRFPGRRHAPLT
jgi:hypothetical protein